MAPWTTAVLRLVGDVFHGGLNGNVGGVGARQRKIGGDERIL